MNPLARQRIAATYLPSRYHYWYSRSKLATDPLYGAVRAALANNRQPLLDVGCGIGLLLQCLRASGIRMPYLGIDSDAAKIDTARSASARGELDDARFLVCDLTLDFPPHAGSVALLDVLQYLEPRARAQLIAAAARCLTPDGLLVIRGGLDDGSWRAVVTRAADRCGHAIRWMGTPFKSQPKPAELATLLARHGLESEFQPLRGRTPFNNWLILARPLAARSAAAPAGGNPQPIHELVNRNSFERCFMRRIYMTLAVAVSALAMSACSRNGEPTQQPEAPPAQPETTTPATPPPPEPTPPGASVRLAPTQGNTVAGTLALTGSPAGVQISGSIQGLKPDSEFGFHIHEKGDCSAPDGSSAGGHFNPTSQPHGNPEAGAHHAGDMLNIHSDAQGAAQVDTTVPGVSLGAGEGADIVGKAIVVHEKADDYTSQPSGASGKRIACGVIAVSSDAAAPAESV